MKKLLLFLLGFCPVFVEAQTAGYYEIDGITYYFTTKEMSVAKSNNFAGSIVIPDSVILEGKKYPVLSIMDKAFEKCTEVTSVSLPDIMNEFGRTVFIGCTNLISINIPSRLSIIPGSTFEGCSKLSDITIPETVTGVGPKAFEGTAWMENQPNGLVYAGNVAYSYKGQMPNNTSIELKEGTISITSSIFYGCNELVSVNIPNSVTEIGPYSFYNCSNLTKVIIGSGVKKIGAGTFSFCTSPLNIYCYAESIPFSSDGIFVGTNKKSLHVLESLINDYQKSNIWGGFSETVALTDSDPKPGVSNSSDIKSIIFKTNDTKYYDLNGHMYKNPHKGLLIRNGKKYFNK